MVTLVNLIKLRRITERVSLNLLYLWNKHLLISRRSIYSTNWIYCCLIKWLLQSMGHPLNWKLGPSHDSLIIFDSTFLDQRTYFTNDKVVSFMHQLLKAVDVLHSSKFFHRDIKPENILVKGDLLKLADFGSARLIHTPQPYTEYISTR